MLLSEAKELILGTTKHIKAYLNGNVVWEAIRKVLATVTGVPPLTLTKSTGENLDDYLIYGKTEQNGTPSPSDPVSIESVGDNESGLPLGYIELDYIESTGTQYIDTEFSPNANTRIDYKVQAYSNVTDTSPLIGARVGSTSNNRFFPIAYMNTANQGRTTYGTVNIVVDITGDPILEGSFDPQNNVSTINGTDYDISNASFTKTNNYNLYLFATSGYGNNLYLSQGKMYYCKIYDNGTLVRNYIPCKNPSSVVGLYDTVNNVFYPSIGTGDFIQGNEVARGGYKIPIKVSGTNLFDAETLFPNNSYTNNGITLTRSGQEFTLNGSREDTTKVYDTYSQEMTLPAGSYTFTIRNNEQFDGNIAMYMYPRENGHDGSLLATSVIGKISNTYYNAYTQRFTLEATTTVRFRSFLNYNNNTVYNNTKFVAQLVKGTYTNSNIIAYEQYFAPTTTNIYLNEPLRRLSNTYCDYIDFKNQKVVRNVKQLTYDGTNLKVVFQSTRYTDYTRLVLSVFSPANAQTGALEEFCNYFQQKSTYSANMFVIGLNNAASLFLADSLIGTTSEDTNSQRIAKANTWLKSLSPYLQIAYPLATPIEESITLPDILTNTGTNIIEIDTSIQPSNTSVDYWQEGS